MDELFQHLETRIKLLLQRCEELEHTNLSLQQSNAVIQQEKQALQAKNQMVISQIENMILNLKSIESAP